MRWWLILAGLNGAVAVAAGAYGAHALDAAAPATTAFETAARYHLVHAVALGVVAIAAERLPALWPARLANLAGFCFVAGMALFCGPLYARGLGVATGMGALVPVGGMVLIGGWLALAAAGMVRRDGRKTP